jgi:preprotein translocase YajC subunit
MGILIIPIFLILMYVVLMRPQQQRVRRQQQLMTSIGAGDEVVTAGGLIGRVVDVTDDRLRLEIADGVVVELLRLAVSRRLEPADTHLEEGVPAMDDFEAEPDARPDHDEAGAGGTAPAEQQVHLPPDPDSH